jgi:hypothetical protein
MLSDSGTLFGHNTTERLPTPVIDLIVFGEGHNC